MGPPTTIPDLEIYPNIWLNITICPLLMPENTLLLTTDLSPNILEPITNTLNTNTLNTNTLNTNTLNTNTLKKKNTMKLKNMKKVKICPHTLNPQNSFKNITIVLKI